MGERERAVQAVETMPLQTSAPKREGIIIPASCSAMDDLPKAEEIRTAQKQELKRWRDNFTQENGRPPGEEDIARDENIGVRERATHISGDALVIRFSARILWFNVFQVVGRKCVFKSNYRLFSCELWLWLCMLNRDALRHFTKSAYQNADAEPFTFRAMASPPIKCRFFY
jgi:hypothetical protein